ncbi:hypothetical protein HPP92_001165 [Vanilla planifolia]|uniref:phospholipase D n=1 Tax=Vanilla planifolia TaxID=51239 RepID=A0A835SC54_VANPL|nr:hypothetical protein HPP92_001165 [Vanilla planifolia]
MERESEPNSWEDTMKDELDRTKYPRMPWHDVHCALWGPPCRDVARHFVQRWNFAKRSKALHEETIPLLMPHHHMVIPHYMGPNKEVINDSKPQTVNLRVKRQESLSSRSSYQDIPLLLPQEPDGLDKASRNQKVEQVIILLSSQGYKHNNGIAQMAYLSIDKEWWEAQEHGDQGASPEELGQVGPRTTCHCQVIRSVGRWSAGTSRTEESIHNAYISLIEKSEHFIYIENQFFISGLSGDDIIRNRVLEAIYKRIMRAHKENKCFRVIIVIPLLPGFQGGIDDSGAASVRALLHCQYRTICRGQNSILQNLYDVMGPKAQEYISFYGLRSYGRLHDSGHIATSQIYVHSKLMIVDDRMALIGSANINDRSLLGSRDSEIGIVIEDKEFVSSSMSGNSWNAGKFSLSLRLSLWSEHLGLHFDEITLIRDPVAEATYKDIWMATAKTNTMIYQDIFSCVPNDLIHSRAALRQSIAFWKEKLGHTTIDLGIAPEKLESYQNGDLKDTDPIERLQSVRGHLVSFRSTSCAKRISDQSSTRASFMPLRCILLYRLFTVMEEEQTIIILY